MVSHRWICAAMGMADGESRGAQQQCGRGVAYMGHVAHNSGTVT